MILRIMRDLESGLVFLEFGAEVDSLMARVAFTATEATRFGEAIVQVLTATEGNELNHIEREVEIL